MQHYDIVDAFTDRVYGGGPAAVLIMDHWPLDAQMQNIAMENNLSETAFLVPGEIGYQLRWFTPAAEIDLCGHATLAAGFIVLNKIHPEWDAVEFATKSGTLTVRRKADYLEMNLPALRPERYDEALDRVTDVLGVRPVEVFKHRDLTVLLESEAQLREMAPDLTKMKAIPEGLGVFVTAPSEDPQYDFADRAFWPKLGIPEDPVCGSAHCNLVPYWSKKLGKKSMVAHQISSRGAVLHVEDCGDWVRLGGSAVLYASGELSDEAL